MRAPRKGSGDGEGGRGEVSERLISRQPARLGRPPRSKLPFEIRFRPAGMRSPRKGSWNGEGAESVMRSGRIPPSRAAESSQEDSAAALTTTRAIVDHL